MSAPSLRRIIELALLRGSLGLVLGSLLIPAPALAQPREAAPGLYGDRQAGTFGDESAGYFGNAAQGNFDNNAVRTPPPGTRALGRVYSGKAVEPPPYLSLPEPLPERVPGKATPDPSGGKPQAPAKKKPAR